MAPAWTGPRAETRWTLAVGPGCPGGASGPRTPAPNSAVALAARVKRVGKEFVGDQRELYLVDHQPSEEGPYERLLTDAMAGDGALFTREDAVEAAWTAVDRVLKTHRRVRPYKPGSWGPKEADALIAADGGWHNPMLDEGTT